VNSRDTKPPKPDEFEIREHGSTLDRFVGVTRQLPGVSREDARKAEDEWQKHQRKHR
jgi:hypothetical protein